MDYVEGVMTVTALTYVIVHFKISSKVWVTLCKSCCLFAAGYLPFYTNTKNLIKILDLPQKYSAKQCLGCQKLLQDSVKKD